MRTRLPLPRGCNGRARSSIVHILAVGHDTFTALLARATKKRCYNGHRPHGALEVRTPNEVHGGLCVRARLLPSIPRPHH